MRVSVATEYGVRGLTYLANHRQNWPISIEEVASQSGVPKSYLLKIFRSLSMAGLVKATRGKDGGFSLQRQPGAITVGEVLEAIEGPLSVCPCVIDEQRCDRAKRCGARSFWLSVQASLRETLTSTTLQTIAAREREVGGNAGEKRGTEEAIH